MHQLMSTKCCLLCGELEALRLEIIDTVDFARAVDISNVKVTKQLRGRVLTTEEIAQLMQTCFDASAWLRENGDRFLTIIVQNGYVISDLKVMS